MYHVLAQDAAQHLLQFCILLLMTFALQKIDFICNNDDGLLRVMFQQQTHRGRHLQNGRHPVQKDAVV